MGMARRQTLVQLTDEAVAALDQRAACLKTSRSQLIREAVDAYLAADSAAAIDAAIVAGYSAIPAEPNPWAEIAARRSIAAEPW